MSDSHKIHTAHFGQGKRDNLVFTLNAGESVTCHFKSNGTDSVTDKYYFIGYTAKKVDITVNLAASITHISGQELKFPKTIPTGGLIFPKGIEWDTIVVRADQDATTFEIYAS